MLSCVNVLSISFQNIQEEKVDNGTKQRWKVGKFGIKGEVNQEMKLSQPTDLFLTEECHQSEICLTSAFRAVRRESPNVALKLVTKPILLNRLRGLSD